MFKRKRWKPIIPAKTDEPRFLFDLKGWLIFYNIALDELLLDVRMPRWESSLMYIDDLQNLDKHVLALEDRKYFKHHGIDFRCIGRIMRQIMKRKRLGGVSTIEQQYVRTYLNRRERTFGRKFNELLLAWLLSHRSNKMDILRTYLSCAYFGYKINGCDSAANFVFSKQSKDLDNQEAAFIASLLVYPLPRKISFIGAREGWFPVSDINQFILETLQHSPWWAEHVKNRMDYSISLVQHT